MASASRGSGALGWVVDRIDAVADRHRQLLSAVGALWFGLVCADYAGFIALPSFVLIGGTPGLIAAVAYNALWWGVLYPRVEARRQTRRPARGEGISNG
ncbi:MAG: hypothetical protein K2P79_12365 [Sphingomonas sp.]|nr:hypothetical protein [Sphingomonas sp.]